MELNKEMKQSIIDETTKIFGTQLPDELLDEISGGRQLKPEEMKSTLAQMDARRGMGQDVLRYTLAAVREYHIYIASLPDDAPVSLFDPKYYDGETYNPERDVK